MPRIVCHSALQSSDVTQPAEFEARTDETILEAGQRAGFSFPSACRNGVCERCAGELIRGRVSIARKNHTIDAGEAESHQVLYCVAHAITDCEINVPDVRAPGELPVHEVTCQIADITQLNDDISRVMLRLPAGKKIQWHAGQYLELIFPFGDCAFSIANAPGGRDIELHVRYHHENSSSLDVIDALNNNATVKARLPGGLRYIDALPETPVWFICGSTGYAPVKAMIEHLRANNFALPIYLFWGARTLADMYMLEEAKQFALDMPNLTFIPALSDEEHHGMHSGLVHEAVLQNLPAAQEPVFFVGGSPPMAWAVFDALVEAGVPGDSIQSDVFDYAPRG